MSVTTSKYRTESAKLFINDFANNDYYLFASSLSGEDTLDNNSEFSKRQLLEKTVFGKQITSNEVFPAIRIVPWQSGSIFAQYDDRADLSLQNFYVVLYPQDQSISDYRIFKCLFNNYDAVSRQAPNYGQSVPDQIYETVADGYVWKYMFSLSEEDFNRYNALGYIPIINYVSTSNGDGSLDQIFVENNTTNDGYTTVSGKVNFADSPDPSAGIYQIVLRADAGNSFNELNRYYNDQWIYFGTPNQTGRLFKIDLYSYNPSTELATVTITDYEGGNAAAIATNDDFDIIPRIEIKGDGSGAMAFPVIENGQIKNIRMYERGVGYTNATATVIDPLFDFNPDLDESVDERAVLRPIISPKGGHGSNPIDELLVENVLVYTGINFIDNNIIPTTNAYTRVAIVKNPEFVGGNPSRFDNRIVVQLEVNPLSVGDIVTQENADNEITFEAVVHQTSNNTVYLTDFMGPFKNEANTSVSFDEEKFLITPQGQLLTINTTNTNIPSYVQKTGEVLYTNSFSAIERTEDSNEQFKIILEF